MSWVPGPLSILCFLCSLSYNSLSYLYVQITEYWLKYLLLYSLLIPPSLLWLSAYIKYSFEGNYLLYSLTLKGKYFLYKINICFLFFILLVERHAIYIGVPKWEGDFRRQSTLNQVFSISIFWVWKLSTSTWISFNLILNLLL